LAVLNRKINEGLTLQGLRNEFGELEKSVANKIDKVALLKSELDFFRDLYNRGERCFGRGSLDERDLAVLAEHNVNTENYHKIRQLFTANENEISEIETALLSERSKLKNSADTLAVMEKISGGVYITSLIEEEKNRRQAAFIPNGAKKADTGLISFSGGKKK